MQVAQNVVKMCFGFEKMTKVTSKSSYCTCFHQFYVKQHLTKFKNDTFYVTKRTVKICLTNYKFFHFRNEHIFPFFITE